MRAPILAILLVAAGAGAARAQAGPQAWEDRAYLTLNGTYQARSETFQQSLTIPKFVETEAITSTYGIARTAGFHVAGGVRVWRNLAVGAGVTRFQKTNSAQVSASIPHPFFFNKPRQIAGDATGVQHQETAVDVEAAWMFPFADRWQIMAFGGPSLVAMRQGLVAAISYSEDYPHDTATFTSATVERQSDTKVGVHAGADVSWMFSRNFGAGGMVRFSRATFTLSLSGGQPVDIHAGGVQVGGGLRVRF